MTDDPNQLRSDDDYERRHMSDESGVLYRDKFVAPPVFHALMGFVTLASVIPAFFTEAAVMLALLATAAPLLFVWLLFSVLRVSVSRDNVNIQLGLFGPKIPISDISSAEAVDYDWKKFGGWGIRRSMDGEWAYNMMGDAGRAVRLEYTDGKGKRRKLTVTAKSPALLVDAIERARGASFDSSNETVLDFAEDPKQDSAQEVPHVEHASR